MLPYGIISDTLATLIGGILGCILGAKLTERWKSLLNNMLGVSALVMGIFLIIKVHTLPVVILSVLIGAVLGEALHIEDSVHAAVTSVTKKISGGSADTDYLLRVSAALVLFCFGGTGWYGALNEGLTGDGIILVTKAILDLFTAGIFGAILGRIVPCLTIPQICVYLFLFSISKLISPYITNEMISDFSSVGGVITFIAGLRLSRIKTDIKVLNILPALILSFLFSGLWSRIIG